MSTTLEIEGGTKIQVNTPEVMYITIGDKVVYVDDSTGQLFIDAWSDDGKPIPRVLGGGLKRDISKKEGEL